MSKDESWSSIDREKIASVPGYERAKIRRNSVKLGSLRHPESWLNKRGGPSTHT